MKLKNKTTLLAAAIALAGVTYLPSASASSTAFIAVDDSIGYASNISGIGAFTDWFDFQVNGTFSLNATANSLTANGTSKGTEITAFKLYDGDHTSLITTGIAGQGSATGSGFSYFGFLWDSPLQANHTYSLEVSGFEHSVKGNYSASLSTISAVPLPGAAWLMLTSMVGFLGYQARNKKTI